MHLHLRPSTVFRSLLALCFTLALGGSATWATQPVPSELKEARITEHLGQKIDFTGLDFLDEAGKTVSLAQFFKEPHRPVFLNFVYYGCPSLCTLVLNGLLDGLKPLNWVPGKQFEIVTISMNHHEGPDLAAAKKANYLKMYGKPEAAVGWHFLTGKEEQIRKLADQVGFGFKWDPKTEQYAHSAGIIALTPEGVVSRYLYGITYLPMDLRLSLLEASSGKVGNVVEKLLMFCYRYDPDQKGYGVYVMRLVQASSAGTFIIFGGLIAFALRNESRRKRDLGSPDRKDTPQS